MLMDLLRVMLGSVVPQIGEAMAEGQTVPRGDPRLSVYAAVDASEGPIDEATLIRNCPDAKPRFIRRQLRKWTRQGMLTAIGRSDSTRWRKTNLWK